MKGRWGRNARGPGLRHDICQILAFFGRVWRRLPLSFTPESYDTAQVTHKADKQTC